MHPQTQTGPAHSAQWTSPYQTTDLLVCPDDSKTRCHCGHSRAEHDRFGCCTGEYIGGSLTEQWANGFTCTCLCYETTAQRRAREDALRILRQAERDTDPQREDVLILVARAKFHINNARIQEAQ